MTSDSDICAVAREPCPLVKVRLLMTVSCMDVKASSLADGYPPAYRSEAYGALVPRSSGTLVSSRHDLVGSLSSNRASELESARDLAESEGPELRLRSVALRSERVQRPGAAQPMRAITIWTRVGGQIR